MSFAASYDRLTKFLTAFLALSIFGLTVASHTMDLALFGLLIIVMACAYSPRGYRIEGHSLVSLRLASQVQLLLDEVREARRITADDLRGCTRLFGSAGFFGYYGLFRSSKLGRFTEYVTNRMNCVIIIRHEKSAA